ncbi:O-antigen ligase family protein [Sphingobium boeckii]|uniref:O-antigen ligase domain-containing protein n=1 Tax=Sphingobium boeckii TaxID=1082345 RepID=A0A7W9AKJ4_9SPHN|nr:O-antigen ligase family protein [Sphingobium boeckii]MBB5687114.1 hypothetical protein [Sphingobium boeckii]
MIEAVFAGFALIAIALFFALPPGRAVIAVCISGWILLPVGHFPAGSTATNFPDWIVGAAVPTDMLLTKMWWPPVVALTLALTRDWGTMKLWRPTTMDLPVALWCLWPLGQSAFVADQDSAPVISALYLAGTWGAPWLLGRVYLAGKGATDLFAALAIGLLILLPMALIEGVAGPIVYDLVYEPHPYRYEGHIRYIGFRPLAFFEHGNHYGIWIAMSALAAVWLWHSAPDRRMRGRQAGVAALGIMMTVIAQSAGAIIWMIGGLITVFAAGRFHFRNILIATGLVCAVGGVAYISGALPLRAIAMETAVGRQMVDAVRSTGRSSFTYRVARDQEAIALIAQHPVAGSGHWDWWRVNGRRPWGLAFQILGQFGLIGLFLAFGTLLWPAVKALASYRYKAGANPIALPLATIVLMAVGDALLNSFLFYPALLAAGALATGLSVSPPGQASRRSAPAQPDISGSRSSDSDR